MFRFSVFLTLFTLNSLPLLAQDTTWVQTFTFDSINARRGTFVFPPELNSKRFEKVLMYYKLKCSPQTPWDQYNCGEWDYLTYTRVFDHTGVFDSTLVEAKKYEMNRTTPESVLYSPVPVTKYDTYTRSENNRSGASLTDLTVNVANNTASLPFDLAQQGGRFQLLLTAAELTNAGVVSGDIESLSLYINSITGTGNLKFPRIAIKSTLSTELTQFETADFYEVYNASHWSGGSKGVLNSGQNELLFYRPYTWNGTDNIVLEFYFENPEKTADLLLFDVEDLNSNSALQFSERNGCMQFSGANHGLLELSDFVVGNEMTICFWSKGANNLGTNTSVLEAYDTLNNRILNIHLPWSDNTLYFDAGAGNGYDRISKGMSSVTEIDEVWNHWAFVKNASTGEMKVYKNGTLWHSGTGKNSPIGYIHRFMLGANLNAANNWKGKLDEFQFYNAALSASTIQEWATKKPDATHPNWNDLLVYYDFDEENWVSDRSDNNHKLMPSEKGMINWGEYPLVAVKQIMQRPLISFGQGSVIGGEIETFVDVKTPKEPSVFFEYVPVNRHIEISQSFLGLESGSEISYNELGAIVAQTSFTGSQSLTNQTVSYYETPIERLNDVEIGRYITPYGIGFDLGADGFSYVYDVSDYQQYLKDNVDLAAHNTQELIDLRFAFVEGIPPRDLHKREAIWSDFKSYQYGDMDADNVLNAVTVQLADSSKSFKIKTRFTGHGHNGSVNCCEWDPKTHEIIIDNVPRFNWEIWQTTECGDNPNIGQGGTWPYAREGWCPGDMVKEFDHELTPFVTPGSSVKIDYDIEDVPVNDAAQGNGNYIVAMDLISYSAPNFTNDAAIVDVLNPNNYEYYRKFNPTCSYPRIILQNTGSQKLTKCKINCWISEDRILEYNWTGDLAFLEKEIVEIPITDLNWWSYNSGEHVFYAEIASLEDGAVTDMYANNNRFTTKFQAPEIVTGPFYVWLTTNNKAAENKYKLIKDNGEVVFERNTLSNQTQYKDTFNLDPGCYSIIIEDSDNDGLSFWYSNQTEGETAGSMRLRAVGGSVFESFPGDFGRYHRFNFSVGLNNLAVQKLSPNAHLSVFPNPGKEEFYIDLGGDINGQANLTLCDLQGRMILEQDMVATSSHADVTLNLKNIPAGVYFVRVLAGGQIYTKELIKN